SPVAVPQDQDIAASREGRQERKACAFERTSEGQPFECVIDAGDANEAGGRRRTRFDNSSIVGGRAPRRHGQARRGTSGVSSAKSDSTLAAAHPIDGSTRSVSASSSELASAQTATVCAGPDTDAAAIDDAATASQGSQ